ncbi:MAG: TIGR02680 family protein [Nocardioidaceae bacterium]
MTAVATMTEVSRNRSERFRLSRAGVLNVWQYDEQEFVFAEGRLLLRGANGAGKSKTLEMLLPFVLDGDKARLTASARHHTSLLWLMTDGYEGQARVGYLWVEFARTTAEGAEERFTCGVGVRASASARTATAWYFTTPRRVGEDLLLEDKAGPLTRPRLAERLGEDGHIFEQARAYKEHVGRALFGLALDQYDEILRLLYWLRQPQVGEDIEPSRLAGQLMQALPELDEAAIRAAGDTFEELVAFGEQIDRRDAAARALTELGEAYRSYARAAAASLGRGLVSAHREQARRRSDLRKRQERLASLSEERGTLAGEIESTQRATSETHARIRQLEDSPEARNQRRLTERAERAAELEEVAARQEQAAGNARKQLDRRASSLSREVDELTSRLSRLAERGRELDASLRRADVPTPLAAQQPVAAPELGEPGAGERVVDAIDALGRLVDEARGGVRRRQAAVQVVRRALDQLTEAQTVSHAEERRAAEAEQRRDESRAQLRTAAEDAETAAELLWGQLQEWSAREECPSLDLPEALTPASVDGLAESAGRAAAPMLGRLRDEERTASVAVRQQERTLSDLQERRVAIEAETDPAPPAPVLGRTSREDGASLWGLVDFDPSLTLDERAGLEAALQSSGLLDAWVRPDGVMLDPEHRDTVLTGGEGVVPGRTLADVLRPVEVPGSRVSHDVVTNVLRRVALHDAEADVHAAGDWVTISGTWSLGPVRGRAAKARAQYVGAAARAEERRRRLEEVRSAIEETHAALEVARAAVQESARKIQVVEVWLRDLPPSRPLVRAWIALEERSAAAERDERVNSIAQSAAREARHVVARRRQELDRLAAENQLSDDPGSLSAVEQQLRSLDGRLDKYADTLPGLRRDTLRVAGQHDALDEERHVVEGLESDATSARQRSEAVNAELAELQGAIGADVLALQRRLEELRSAQRQAEADMKRHEARASELDRAIGGAENACREAGERLAEHQDVVTDSVRALSNVVHVPGLVRSAFDGGELPDTSAIVAAAADPGDTVPRDVVATALGMAELDPRGEEPDSNAVYKAWNEAVNGPAADHEPRVVPYDGLLAVAGRDEGGESPIAELAARVAAGVEHDRQLLTAKERDRFEQHILGELGDAIRRRRMEAVELVEAMNRLLDGVSTSQGIRVRLDWRLRDDVPSEVTQAVRLLTEPVGALLPDERAALRDSLHRLIDASRAEQPELSYSEHLAVALDYRRWFAFQIRYTRPETEGRWLQLHRRSPLSQGEQKVLCYLPLFAAAAAHFSSLAGAAPHAPRLVLLDDAFPKIDVRTHPLLFGLLVQLDLDFVITSERLWGDHETVPSLAIYEALRDPSQRGIAQYEFRWDGRVLRALS